MNQLKGWDDEAALPIEVSSDVNINKTPQQKIKKKSLTS